MVTEGLLIWQLDLFDRAIDCYQKVIEIDENNEYAYLGVGLNLYSIEKYPEAIFYLEKLTKLDPKHVDAYYYLGLAHKRSQNMVLADEALNTALSLSPKRLDLLHAKAALMYDLENYEAAILTYNKIVAIEPKDALGWYDLACCYALQGNSESALASLKQAIELAPDRFRQHARTDADLISIRDCEPFEYILS